MALIKNYGNDSSVSAEDKVIGTDVDNNNQTKNYRMLDIATYVASTLDGFSQVLSNYTFLGTTTEEVSGYFLQPDPTTLVFAAIDNQGNNNSVFFQEIGDNLNNVLFGVVRNTNDFSYFTVSALVNNTSSFTLTVAPLANLSTGSFVLENIYSAGITPTKLIKTYQAGTNITIDETDPVNPIINSSASGTTPNLQAVTDEGAITTNPITISNNKDGFTVQNPTQVNSNTEVLFSGTVVKNASGAGDSEVTGYRAQDMYYQNTTNGKEIRIRPQTNFSVDPLSGTTFLEFPYLGTGTFTLATTSQLADLVTTNTEQTITAKKTFNGSQTFNTVGATPVLELIGNRPYWQMASSGLTQVTSADRGAMFINAEGNIQFYTPDGVADRSNFVISNALLTDVGVTRRTYSLPDKDGTFAMLDDIPAPGTSISTVKTVISAAQVTSGSTVDLMPTSVGDNYIQVVSLMVKYGSGGETSYNGGGNLRFRFGAVDYNVAIPFSSTVGRVFDVKPTSNEIEYLSNSPLQFSPSVTPTTGDATIVVTVQYVVNNMSAV